MSSDIRQGAVLPPVVIGALADPKAFDNFPITDASSLNDFLPQDGGEIAIIDGMQRTASLMEASTIDPLVLDKHVRVEFWLAQSVTSMIYRMLVLNTGQVPWTLARQLAVIYAPLLAEIRKNVGNLDRIFSPDKPGRRVGPAQFGSDALVELYMAFSLRKTTVDTKEALSEEFSRLDFIENLSDDSFQSQFYTCLEILAELDKSFSRFDNGGGGRFAKGRNIFDGQPARIGLIVAVALHVLGRPGLDRSAEERRERMNDISTSAKKLTNRLDVMEYTKVCEFLKLDVLSETLDKRVGQVGRYERAFFFEAFKVLIEEKFNIPNLESCWRAN
jgi:hypothetical protein